MLKIEDIVPKNYQEIFNIERKKKNYQIRPPLFLVIIFLFVFYSFNSVAAPLEIPQLKVAQLSYEHQKKKESLEAELQKVINQIKEYEKTIAKIRSQKKSIQNEIKLTDSKIKKTELEIKAINLNIKRLNQKITQTKKSIVLTEEKIEKSKKFLADSLKYYYQLRQRSVVEVFLANAHLSNYFSNFFYLQKLQEEISSEIQNLEELNKTLNKQKKKLEEEREEQNSLLSLVKVKYAELQDLKKQKQILLAQVQKKESKYNKLLKEAQRTAEQIRQEIYRLAGGVAPINFGEAVRLAEIVEKYTNVRPAFLLAVLHYESRIGQNVGSCHYKEAMKPSERPVFEKIVTELGLDPNKMPVSCKPWYGWGGAMGPAQFIPSTWMAYRDRVSKITGNNPPSPWNIFDAFVAAALKLKDAGANKRTYNAEWKAAMIYFAGSNWNKPSLRFYGDDVMSVAQRFQNDINILKGSR